MSFLRGLKITSTRVFVALIACVLAGCGSNPQGVKITPLVKKRLTQMNLSDTSSLLIAQGLFKISSNGGLSLVENDAAYPPVALYHASETWLVLGLGWNPSALFESYLVRASDGASFSLADGGNPAPMIGGHSGASAVQSDGAGNIYYLRSNCKSGPCFLELVRVDPSNPQVLAVQTVSPANEAVSWFEVSTTGHVLYSGRMRDGSGDIKRIRKSNGALFTLPTTLQTGWSGADSDFYYTDSAKTFVQHVTIDANLLVSTSNYGITAVAPALLSTDPVLKVGSRVLIPSSGGAVLEANGAPSGNSIWMDLSEAITSVTYAVASSNYYYLAGLNAQGESTLVRVNPIDVSVTDLLTPGAFEIYALSVSPQDVLAFNALRLNDGQKIIGRIDASVASPSVEIIDEQFNLRADFLISF